MRIYQIRRYLKRLRPAPGTIPLRFVILATLINVAVVFGSVTNNPRHDGDKQSDQTGAETPHQDASQKSFWLWVFHHPGDFSGVMVAVFNGLLVYVTYRLVDSTNKLWDAGEKQRRSSEEIAALQRASSEKIGQAQVRAYVDIRTVEIIFIGFPGAFYRGRPEVQPIIKIIATNTGNLRLEILFGIPRFNILARPGRPRVAENSGVIGDKS